MLEVRPPIGPDLIIEPGGAFESFRTFELIYDSTERERKGLSLRRMYRTIAPWATENPIIMHVRNAEPISVRLAIDQCAEVGFEMVIMTFGSGFNMENVDPDYIEQIKELVYNPLNRTVKKQLKLPLYYTGLTGTASIREQHGRSSEYLLDREYNVDVPVDIAPRSVIWFVVK